MLMYSNRESALLQSILKHLVDNIPQYVFLPSDSCPLTPFFQPVFKLLTYRIIIPLFGAFSKEDQPILATALVNVSFGSNCTLDLLEFLIEDEFVSKLGAGQEILRENGMVIRFLKAYLDIINGSFLADSLGAYVRAICNDKKLSFEINPAKVSNEETAANMDAFKESVSSLISTLTNSRTLEFMPPGIRMIAKYVAERSHKYQPSHLRIYVGSFLMLRLINPALFSPEKYGLLPGSRAPSAGARRNLILVTKVLQNISNDIKVSKKEPYMNNIDEGGHWQRMLYDWFDEIVNVRYNPQSIHDKVTKSPITVTDLHTLHSLLFQYRDQIVGTFEKKEDAKRTLPLVCPSFPNFVEFNSLLERLGSYSNKESFSFLEETHNRLVRQMLSQRNAEASYLGYINVQKKSKKSSEVVRGILVITAHRIILLAENGKVGADVHQLQLTKVRSTNSDNFELIFADKAILGVSNEVDEILSCIHRSFNTTFPGMLPDSRFKLEVSPADRLAHLQSSSSGQTGSCDNIVAAYRSICDLYQVDPVEEVCWDLDRLFQVLNFTTSQDLFSRSHLFKLIIE